MKSITDLISETIGKAFTEAGYDAALGAVSVSNRPDLCEFQCNGAMAGAKRYKKAPLAIAEEVCACLPSDAPFMAEVAPPGFLNITVGGDLLHDYLYRMSVKEKKFGLGNPMTNRKIVLDYGGPNVAKPLHVGHLRSAVIGESIKRILRYAGADVTGDIHMGDWGMPMGLIIAFLQDKDPSLPYFDESFTGEYPKEAPFTVSELEAVYPAASARAKEDEAFHTLAMDCTRQLQEGRRGYRALWHHIKNVSTLDLKRNYDRLDVAFDLWKGESDVDARMTPMVEELQQKGIARESDGALVIDVSEEDDKKELPPCIIRKSDGAALYATSDLATILERMEQFRPDEMIYITDKRQEMHFRQVFRAARKARFVFPETVLTHIGFGTMNGRDGKPFKTRDGGVPRLEDLLNEIEHEMQKRIEDSDRSLEGGEAKETAQRVSLAALKYGDLSNQPSKDYVFDPEKFTAFEGDTGPYLLYTIVRIKSVLRKYKEAGHETVPALKETGTLPENAALKALALEMCGFADSVREAAGRLAPNRLCAYLYALCNAVNSFYHETKILSEPDEILQELYVALMAVALSELEEGIGLLGFSSPEQM